MATVRYTAINGRVIAEKRGGVRKLYRPDHLGSTIALYDNTQAKTDTWVYWPYGAVRTRTGTTATPFQFVGVLGYFRDSSDRTYVRARTYRQTLGIWQTRDPLWPEEPAYVYAAGAPTTNPDPGGLRPIGPSFDSRTPCFSCMFAIRNYWVPHPMHFANHAFSHCMACCTLTRLQGKACAERVQDMQNWCDYRHWWSPNQDKVCQTRLKWCRAGIEIGIGPVNPPSTPFGDCHRKCLMKFPTSASEPEPSSFPYLAACNPTNWCILNRGDGPEVYYTGPERPHDIGGPLPRER